MPPYAGLGTPLAQTRIGSLDEYQCQLPPPGDKSKGQDDEDQDAGNVATVGTVTRQQGGQDPSSHLSCSVA